MIYTNDTYDTTNKVVHDYIVEQMRTLKYTHEQILRGIIATANSLQDLDKDTYVNYDLWAGDLGGQVQQLRTISTQLQTLQRLADDFY